MPRKKPPVETSERPETEDDLLLTTQEVAGRLQLTRQTVQRLIKAGKLKASRIGRDWRVKRSALEAFLKATETR